MPKTLLAVDDSATMRKVLEITFSGEDFKVITADGHQAALAKLSEEPKVCVIDTTLGSDDGYALCKEIRSKDDAIALILLSSRYTPYDQAKGKDCGADDYMDKPFDTQQLIDKVRKAILTKEGGAPAAEAKPAAAAAPPAAAAAAPKAAVPVANVPHAPAGVVPPLQPRGTQPSLGGHVPGPSRSSTLMFDNNVTPQAAAPAPAPLAPAKRHNTPMQHTPVTTGTPSDAPPMTTAATPAALHAANGHLAAEIGKMGLSPAQADAVLALSRDVIERVVWEVVPQLAETMIKEEIARLMRP